MLLPENVRPENSLFLNGGAILDALLRLRQSSFFELFIEVRRRSTMSMPLFVLSLDWLYLANCINVSDDGRISPCS